jgi:hypothetical protein
MATYVLFYLEPNPLRIYISSGPYFRKFCTVLHE